MEVTCEKFVIGRRLEYKLLVLCNMSQKDELAPNVMAMVQSFNRLALLVPTEILEEKTPQARSKVITSFIQVRKFRFHSQFTVFHFHVRLNLVLIPIPEEKSNLIGHFDLKFTYNGRQVNTLQKCTLSQVHALPYGDMLQPPHTQILCNRPLLIWTVISKPLHVGLINIHFTYNCK